MQKNGFGTYSTTNKVKNQFTFDFSNNQIEEQKKNYIKSKQNKKLLNLTATLPKGLLSPTNNGGSKHKHAEYFESAQTLAYTDMEKPK